MNQWFCLSSDPELIQLKDYLEQFGGHLKWISIFNNCIVWFLCRDSNEYWVEKIFFNQTIYLILNNIYNIQSGKQSGQNCACIRHFSKIVDLWLFVYRFRSQISKLSWTNNYLNALSGELVNATIKVMTICILMTTS